MANQVNLAILGSGLIGAIHARAIAEVSNARLSLVIDSARERADALAAEYGVPAVYDLSEALQRHDVDAVHVCVPSGLHAKLGTMVAEAGKHVLVEKPIDITLPAGRKLVEAGERTGAKIAVIFQKRFTEPAQRIRTAVERGELGRLIQCDAYVKWYREPKYYSDSPWHGTWAMDGGGALINQGVHMVDLLKWIGGPVRSVFARRRTALHDIEVEDLVDALVEFESGALGVIQASTALYPGFPERLDVHGTRGSAVLEGSALAQWAVVGQAVESGAGALPTGHADPGAIGHKGHVPVIQDFVDAILQDREPMVSGRDGLETLELVMAVYKSAQEGREVTLPLPEDWVPEPRVAKL
ncbi:MAG: Gfo/Idh/MocA family oxidoreductase [Anaerolineae bacterium]|nr:Gfo/Idh/MocA family oxidoreductase [Anaerolineae bacterium]